MDDHQEERQEAVGESSPPLDDSAAVPPAEATYRPHLMVAFLVCFLWTLFFASTEFFDSVFGRLLPFAVPIPATMAILDRTPLYQDRPRKQRLALFGAIGIVLTVLAFALMMVVFLFLFGMGAIEVP